MKTPVLPVARTSQNNFIVLGLDSVGAILRDPGNSLFPSRITVFCDDCGLETVNEYFVTPDLDKADRLEFARAYLRTQDWQCDELGDFCPDHKEQP